MPPQRRKPRNDRPKVIAIAILGVLLLAVLMWPSEEPVAAESHGGAGRRFASPSPKSPTAEASSSTAADAAGRPLPKLPRLESETIAALDPFSTTPRRSEGADGESLAEPDAFVAASAHAPVRAVYRTSQGAVAIVDDQIIPVRDVDQWIANLRAAEGGQ